MCGVAAFAERLIPLFAILGLPGALYLLWVGLNAGMGGGLALFFRAFGSETAKWFWLMMAGLGLAIGAFLLGANILTPYLSAHCSAT
jgi:hypothetical protein